MCFFSFYHNPCKMGIDLTVIILIFLKYSLMEHQSVRYHKEFQLFIFRGAKTNINHLIKRCIFCINKAQYSGLHFMYFIHGINHLGSGTGNR